MAKAIRGNRTVKAIGYTMTNERGRLESEPLRQICCFS